MSFLYLLHVFKLKKSHYNYDLDIFKGKCRDIKTKQKYVTKGILKLEDNKEPPKLIIKEKKMGNLSEIENKIKTWILFD